MRTSPIHANHPVLTLVIAAAVLSAGTAQAVPVVTMIDSLSISGLSANGTVACGNSVDGLYEACRWTAADGFVRLGRGAVAATGHSGGMPGISGDGNRVASSIASTDTVVTQGLWIKGFGWQECMPPLLPDGMEIDQSYGSAWDLSRDGTTVVGLYWRVSHDDGSAHASKWTAAGGLVDLGSQGHDSRANGVNGDGSVVVGWSASPPLGNAWQPTVWDADGLTVLTATDMWCEAWAVNDAGTIVGGDSTDYETYTLPMITAAMWKRTATGWDEFKLGVLPGTFGNAVGHATALAVSEDGTIVAGVNAYDYNNMVGFIWTEDEGLMKARDYFLARGAVLPSNFTIRSVTAIANNGQTFAGHGYDPADWRAPPRSFIVAFAGASDVPTSNVASAAGLTSVYPNPFNPSTTIEFAVGRAGQVRVEIHDLRGFRVRTLYAGDADQGSHRVTWNGRDDEDRGVASGTYRVTVTGSDNKTSAQSLTLVR
jgi:uncharacterized membrane protein